MVDSRIKQIYETEERWNKLKAELKDIQNLENELALKLIKFKERVDRTEKDIFEWINLFTKDLREGKNGM